MYWIVEPYLSAGDPQRWTTAKAISGHETYQEACEEFALNLRQEK